MEYFGADAKSGAGVSRGHSAEATRFLVNVYMWMFGGVGLTSLVAGIVASTPSIVLALSDNPVLLFGLLFAQLGLVIFISAAIGRISAGTATLAFLLYSALTGVTFSVFLLVYTGESILMAFVSAACLFGTMSLYGYATRRDLTSWGSLLTVGLIAIIVCSVINLFLGSSGFHFLISLAGVVIFLGLTAYDTQKILAIGDRVRSDEPNALRKLAILGALRLYLDFINLFIFMLRLLGRRR